MVGSQRNQIARLLLHYADSSLTLEKKIDAILKMQAPTNLKELCSFIGAVTFYSDMAPLTEMTGSQFVWNDEHQKAFDEMKALIASDALFNIPIQICHFTFTRMHLSINSAPLSCKTNIRSPITTRAN